MGNNHYVELLTEVKWNSEWFRNLRKELERYPANWQDSRKVPYHATVAFMDEVEDIDSVCDRVCQYKPEESAAVDMIDVFTDFSGKRHIISLSAKQPYDGFASSAYRLIDTLLCTGAKVETRFKFHITLGDVDASKVSLGELTECVKRVTVPPFEMRFSQMRLVRRDDHKILQQRVIEGENIFSYESIRKRCEMFLPDIIAHKPMAYILRNRKVRFIDPEGCFGYTAFGNFYFDRKGVMMLVTRKKEYVLYHRRDVLGDSLWSTVPVIYAGVETEFKDDTGRTIYTGDIVSGDEFFASMVNYLPWEKEPSLKGDNCDVMLSDCRNPHIEGTTFSELRQSMFGKFSISDVCWSYSQFIQGGISREEVFRRAQMAMDKPHFSEPLEIRRRSPKKYRNIEEEMKGDFVLTAFCGTEEYDEELGIGATIYADNIPKDYDEPLYYIKIEVAPIESFLNNLKEGLEQFFVHAHEHPETKFILCDFVKDPNMSVELYRKEDIARLFLPIKEYELGNVVVPDWLWFEVIGLC